jgi:hypothetical protein
MADTMYHPFTGKIVQIRPDVEDSFSKTFYLGDGYYNYLFTVVDVIDTTYYDSPMAHLRKYKVAPGCLPHFGIERHRENYTFNILTKDLMFSPFQEKVSNKNFSFILDKEE